MLDVTSIIILIIILSGESLPLVQARAHGFSLSFKEYYSPMTKRSIFGFNNNNKIFDALREIRDNKLDISFAEMERMYVANVDYQNLINAVLIIKRKNITVSHEVLETLAFSSKDLIAIIDIKKDGEEIVLADAYEVVWQKYFLHYSLIHITALPLSCIIDIRC
jgi:uncharacterized protein YqfA (UPF0365 family)